MKTHGGWKRVVAILLAVAYLFLGGLGLGPCRGDDGGHNGCPPGQHPIVNPEGTGTYCVPNG